MLLFSCLPLESTVRNVLPLLDSKKAEGVLLLSSLSFKVTPFVTPVLAQFLS